MVKLSELKTKLETLNYKVSIRECLDLRELVITINENVLIGIDTHKKWTFLFITVPEKNSHLTMALHDKDNNIEKIIEWVGKFQEFINAIIDITIETNNLKPTYDGLKVIE